MQDRRRKKEREIYLRMKVVYICRRKRENRRRSE